MEKALETEEKQSISRISVAFGKTKYVKKEQAVARRRIYVCVRSRRGDVDWARAECMDVFVATHARIYTGKGEGADVIGRRVEAISRHDGCLTGIAAVAFPSSEPSRQLS